MKNVLPNDPMLCLSVVNTKLRDYYSNLELLCEDMEIDRQALTEKLAAIDYAYDENQNQFI